MTFSAMMTLFFRRFFDSSIFAIYNLASSGWFTFVQLICLLSLLLTANTNSNSSKGSRELSEKVINSNSWISGDQQEIWPADSVRTQFNTFRNRNVVDDAEFNTMFNFHTIRCRFTTLRLRRIVCYAKHVGDQSEWKLHFDFHRC